MARDQGDGGFRGGGPLIAVASVLFAAGIALLALGVWFELPGPLDAYSDPAASWPVVVQVLLGATGFLGWWWVNRRRTRAFTVVLLTLGIGCVLILGLASYARCPQDGQSPFWSVVSRVLGLVLNNYNIDDFAQPSCELGAPPLALQVAHLSQLVVLLVAATSAVVLLLRGQLDRLVVRFSRRVFLAVAVDGSAASLLPALSKGARGWTRAIVTKDPGAAWLSAARVAGWRVVAGDPDETAVLRTLLKRSNNRHALRGLAVLSPDSVEAQRLIQAVDVATRGLTPAAPVRTLLRIDDAWQAEDWRRRYLSQPQRWVVDTISENEVTARLLVRDARDRGAKVLMIVGHSNLTFAVLAEVAQQAREDAFAGLSGVPDVVLVDPEARRVQDEHALAQRGFGNEVAGRAEVRETDDVEAVLREVVGVRGPVALLFTGDVDDGAGRLATRLGALHHDVLVYTRQDGVVGVGVTPLLAEVRAYGITLDAGEGRPVDRWERIARLNHEAYVRDHPDPANPTNPARLPWDAGLSTFLRESNIRQVVTTLGSAVEVGRSWGATSDPVPDVEPSGKQLEEMARLEHESWCRHQEENGRRHQDLVPWDQLGEASRGKSRDGVRATLALLSTLGYRSFDDPQAQWRPYRRHGEVVAIRRDAGWEWTSSGGATMRAEVGDWEVTDPGGSRSVSAEVFELTHEHLEGDRWRRTGQVRARRARAGERAVSPEGTATAGEGQWLLEGVAGDHWLVPDARFKATYTAMPDDGESVGQ